VALVLILLSSVAHASSTRTEKPNAFSISFLDTLFFYSVNYDRNLTDWFGIGGGAAYVGTSNNGGALMQLYANFYPVGTETTSMLLSVGGVVSSQEFTNVSFTGDHGYGTLGVGIEYRKNFLFRGKLNMIYSNKDFFAPWPGFSVGFAF